jgi:two-component system cell cycle response regulator DivK
MARILLVEDNELNSDMLSRRLMRRGFEVEIVGDGRQCLEVVCQRRPDLILMDMGLPVMDGYEATRRLKADGRTRAIPVIGLSARTMEDEVSQALSSGCDDFDVKPVELTRLLTKMNALLADPGPPPAA